MLHNIITYSVVNETAIMRIDGGYTVDVRFDAKWKSEIEKLHWCLDSSKYEIYAMDFSMTVPNLIGIVSPRVYLWKYIAYLATNGRVIKRWLNREPLNYCVLPTSKFVVEAQL